MIGHLRRNAVAYLALFVALGGTSYAAMSLAPNSVGTAQLKNGAVTAPKVRRNSLVAADFQANSLPRGPRGATGPRGVMGPAGLSASAASDDLPAGTATGSLSSAVPIKHVTISLPRAGNLVIVDSEVDSLTFNNPTNSTVNYAAVGLYLDGAPVPNGAVLCQGCSIPPAGSSVAGPFRLPDLRIPNVSAGMHTLTLALSGQSTNYVTSAKARLVVLATG
jgi:hypothetical protein